MLPVAFRAAVLAPIIAAAACRYDGAPAITAATPVEIDGVGPIRIGMPLADASRLLGEHLAVSESVAGSTCAYATPRSGPGGLSFMLDDRVIVRIDVTGGAMRTTHGIAVGSAEAQVLEAYAHSTEVMPHKYDAEGHYVVVKSPGSGRRNLGPGGERRKLRYVFETSRGIVTKFRAGALPAVGYVEGCS